MQGMTLVENQINLISMQSLSKVTIEGMVIRNTINMTSSIFLVD